MLPLLQHLKSRIVGQDAVLGQIASLIECSNAGFRYPETPVCSILAIGATGVGKTFSALAACEYLFGSATPENLARFDMSEYGEERTAIKRLLGDGDIHGVFELNFNQTNHHGILLFDEIEKAEPRVLDVLLQVLSAARITMANGHVLDLSQYIVFCTSNIGGRLLMESSTQDQRVIRERAENAALQELRPELLNRFDLVAAYAKLGESSTYRIAQIHVEQCIRIFAELGHQIEVDDTTVQLIRRLGFSDKFGARPIRREAMRVIGEAVMAKKCETGRYTVCGRITYDVKTGRCGIV
jgi:ATP-dependent Clp protease ATP-binding subunit ClpA